MIETTKVWEIGSISFDVSPTIKNQLMKKYGSKRSGTIYLVANNEGEAIAIVNELFTRNGFTPPKKVHVCETHLVKQALRMI